jgi:ABC-2 type transport system ATP-binding protein
LWWDLPLSESFTILKEIYSVSDEDYKERMEFFTNVLGLDEFIMQPVRTLSLGQRMKADLAASLLHNPKILFLDEPTIGLDVVVKEKVREAIKEIHAKYGTTIILTTHDLQDIEELCTRIIIIDEGRLVYTGNREDLLEKFGSKTILNVRFSQQEKIDEDSVKKLFLEDKTLCKKGNLEFSFTEGVYSIGFSKKEFSSSEILKKILQEYQIEDFSVHATSIEDIVKMIYNDASTKRVE